MCDLKLNHVVQQLSCSPAARKIPGVAVPPLHNLNMPMLKHGYLAFVAGGGLPLPVPRGDGGAAQRGALRADSAEQRIWGTAVQLSGGQ